MPNLQELGQAKAIIEQFAAPVKLTGNAYKPYRIGTRRVDVWVIPVSYIANEQLIEVRRI